MSGNPGNGREGLPIELIKRQLKAISAIDPPPALRDKLEAGIPAVAADPPITPGIRAWWRGVRWAGVAAAMVIAASAILWLAATRVQPRYAGIDTKADTARAYAADYNSLRPSDTNLCDINGLH